MLPARVRGYKREWLDHLTFSGEGIEIVDSSSKLKVAQKGDAGDSEAALDALQRGRALAPEFLPAHRGRGLLRRYSRACPTSSAWSGSAHPTITASACCRMC